MAERRLDWEDLRVFLAVAEAGSLVGAAAALRLSQPTVGRRLKALEGTVGALLFDRLPNGLVLTTLGHDLLRAAGPMAPAADAVARRAALAPDGRRLVRITTTGSVGLFLSLHARRLADDAPLAELLVIATRRRLSLARREADMALRMRRLPEEGDLVARRLGRIGFALYATADLAQRANPAGLEVIGMEPTDRVPSQSAWLDAVAARGRMVLRLGDVGQRHRAAVAGVGATLLPCFLGDADPALVRLALPPPELAEDIHLLLHRDLRGVAAIRELSAALTGLFRREAAALAGEDVSRGAGSS